MKTDWLHRKTLTASAGSAGIGVYKVEAFSVQAITEIEGGIENIQETLEVGNQLYAFIFKHLVVWLRLVVKLHIVGKARATARQYAHAYEVLVGKVVLHLDFVDLRFGSV
mgnify:CR=1 FL=1